MWYKLNIQEESDGTVSKLWTKLSLNDIFSQPVLCKHSTQFSLKNITCVSCQPLVNFYTKHFFLDEHFQSSTQKKIILALNTNPKLIKVDQSHALW